MTGDVERVRALAHRWRDVGGEWVSGQTYEPLTGDETLVMRRWVKNCAERCATDSATVLAVSAELHLHWADAERLCAESIKGWRP